MVGRCPEPVSVASSPHSAGRDLLHTAHKDASRKEEVKRLPALAVQLHRQLDCIGFPVVSGAGTA